ncbi:hypothetical protein F5Y04DRAFT_242077 [Hypomontagnella monticulosa]|nr:hypothetical protein F5Y04DRAFT_242077 [Hypomontagnella monticulosa]
MTTIFDIPGSYPPNSFMTSVQTFLTSNDASSTPALSLNDAAVQLVNTITNSLDPAHALWELWDAFFTAVATCSTSHAPHLALLDALRVQPPTLPSNVPEGSDAKRQLRSCTQADGMLHWEALPRFGMQWRDVHDVLEAWRDWDGVRASQEGESQENCSDNSCGGDKYFLRFSIFSAALLKAKRGEAEVHPIWVFYACRDVLEREGPLPRPPKAHRLPLARAWALDVRVAATWVRDGGRVLWETDQEKLRRDWAAALDGKTELWPRRRGLTRERWRLWGERLRRLRREEWKWDEETNVVIAEAAEVVESLLKSSTSDIDLFAT